MVHKVIKIFVFVSPHEVDFMKQFFNPSMFADIRSGPLQWFVSGGDCNPIKYGEYK